MRWSPFTRRRAGGTNFGLGLPYAYQVMRKHGGSLAIRSKAGQGTSVYLTLPIRSVQARPVSSAPSAAQNPKEAGLDASR
uniref:ATP-binding protein n=1 Tax=Cohnella rhizosphaerae TaxID=1457232 RepID=UPI003B8A8387